MLKILTTVIFILTLFQYTLCAQDTIVSFPSFELYAGASYSSGLRIGGRWYIIENLSVESSVGQDLVNLFSPSDNNFRGSLGITFHAGYHSNLFINSTYTQIINAPINFSGYAISLNIGSLSLTREGLNFYYSGGLWLKKLYNIKAYYFLPNIELGLFYRF